MLGEGIGRNWFGGWEETPIPLRDKIKTGFVYTGQDGRRTLHEDQFQSPWDCGSRSTKFEICIEALPGSHFNIQQRHRRILL